MNISPEECILWDGAVNSMGYGQVRDKGKTKYVHRLVWKEKNGTIPKGMVIMHKCDTPLCVNQEHLVLGSQGDNLRDMMQKGRGRKQFARRTYCISGHKFSSKAIYFARGAYRIRNICKACGVERTRRYKARLRTRT